MPERSHRFRRLARAETGDLFEHFGIEIEPRRSRDAEAVTPDEATACRGCGWYVTSRQASTPCPICTEPRPWGDGSPSEPTK